MLAIFRKNKLPELAERMQPLVDKVNREFLRESWFDSGYRTDWVDVSIPWQANFIPIGDETIDFITRFVDTLNEYHVDTQYDWWIRFLYENKEKETVHQTMFLIRFMLARANIPALTAFLAMARQGYYGVHSPSTHFRKHSQLPVVNGRALLMPIPKELTSRMYTLYHIVEIDDEIIDQFMRFRANHPRARVSEVAWASLVAWGVYTRRYPLIRYLTERRPGERHNRVKNAGSGARSVSKIFGTDRDHAITEWILMSTYLNNQDSAFEWESYKFAAMVVNHYCNANADSDLNEYLAKMITRGQTRAKHHFGVSHAAAKLI